MLLSGQMVRFARQALGIDSSVRATTNLFGHKGIVYYLRAGRPKCSYEHGCKTVPLCCWQTFGSLFLAPLKSCPPAELCSSA